MPVGRIPVLDVFPVAEEGRFPAKATVGEAVRIRATVIREGHDALGATAVLLRPDGSVHASARMVDVAPGLDRYEARLVPDAEGDWSFRVEGWSDPYGTWAHDAAIKVEAGLDVELMLTEGTLVLERAAARTGDDAMPGRDARVVLDAVAALRDTSRPPLARLAAALSEQVREVLERSPLRDLVTTSRTYPLVVHRRLALAGSWYEMFPRSHGATFDEATQRWTSGTLRTAATQLPRIAAMGFDVVYLTPIHPIGTTYRKGRNNALTALPGDPGSPYAIGSPDGGHDAIEPSLGTFDDFDAFVARARSLGMEVALDLALQASPDHPWVTEHPEWFTTRADGTIAYAENPPKKYQDIYPLNFDNDPEGIYTEIRRVLQVWIDHGVTAFRVDNPHTKPLSFWQRLLAEVHAAHPEVIFLSEAFTRPAMMLTLAKIGFHQSYTYFTWRNTKSELEEYLARVGGDEAPWLRPSFWPTTHDILPPYLQQGGPSAFAVRAVLAATGSPTWGVYSGYELAESVPRPGVEEQIDNEKYEFRPRDWARADELGIALLIGRLNEIRRAHPALQQLSNVRVHPTTDDALVAFSRHLDAEHSPTGRADTVVVIVNIDPFAAREGAVHLDLTAFGLPPDRGVVAHDVLSGESYGWSDEVYVRLDPQVRVAHVVHLEHAPGAR
ncbi:alpha-1,4-glucan--maltose-1-phosphate maltosyltransferase [Cellulomonas dongxiuzhuiae]|uniref:Alpha-1,4-glucan:maltose-1-phosphate maltosyltransferase n=1 Tax=Cellulomonas dongxiuzhuiae TaxID=2819979 RepID=A0ABX8GNQ1_9CELL|nr:alpha-1,4-glucan--maltose-1-phosphate maltosyltransferase [Cellulomonas dongxiuzhuiae]MBO3095732.1 alpha-1,4-glucan--maltose-1-phosphate maltosyltransferase [Cellulomonas dongxiuzhuiae]QWC17769.1 alpha-1,4-glucan--maltose-1-phosphate maltosyltransferase [Cellulomonas dongxiuzhuiae]